MDAEMMIAIRQARVNSRTAWKGMSNATRNDSQLPIPTHPGEFSLYLVTTYRTVTR